MRDRHAWGGEKGEQAPLVGEEGGQARVGRGIFGSSDQLHRNTLDRSNKSNSQVVGVALEIQIKSRTKKSTSAIPLLWC